MDLTSLAKAVASRPTRWQLARAMKLSWYDVEDIRTALADGKRQKVLAALYGVSQSMISHINRGNRWKRSQ